jgi:integrase
MARRRGHGEGSIYRRADGYWVGQIEAGRGPDGRRRRARVVRKRKADVLAALDDLRRRAADGALPARVGTVATLLDFYVAEVVDVTPGTRKEYGARVDRLRPLIGHHRLDRLTVAHCQAAANQLARDYSTGTVRVTLTLLRSALEWAVGADLLAKNVGRYVTGPRAAGRAPDDTLTPDEVARVLEAAAGTEWHAPIWLALRYGLRIGELVALEWQNVDLAAGTLTVAKAKTAAGERTLPLTPEALDVLRAHRARAPRIHGHVFTDETGHQRPPGAFRRAWNQALADAGVEHQCRNCGAPGACSTAVRRFHASRHTAATAMLEQGVPLEVVSAILGHSAIGITANVYSRVRADAKRRALSN